MPINRRKMESSLQAKGFERDPQGSHVFFRHQHEGRYTGIYTMVSHTRRMRDISGDLLTLIRKQLKLDRSQEVKNLLECPMTQEDYVQILEKKDLL